MDKFVIQQDELPELQSEDLLGIERICAACALVRERNPGKYNRKSKTMLVGSFQADGTILVQEVSTFRRRL